MPGGKVRGGGRPGGKRPGGKIPRIICMHVMYMYTCIYVCISMCVSFFFLNVIYFY